MYKVDGFKIGTAAASLEASHKFYFGERKIMKKLSYDPACESLAEHFLLDTEVVDSEAHMRRLIDELSQAIQDAVDQWFDTSESLRR
jgi:Ser/Thr protein kinase RdoA (MazF antagonist)